MEDWKDIMLCRLDEMRAWVVEGKIRYLQMQGIRDDDCLVTTSAGEASYIERLGLTEHMANRHKEIALMDVD